MFAADKFGYIDEHEKWLEAISDFVQTYIDGGRFVVYNSRNQFLADFDTLDKQYTTKKRTSLKTNY